MSEDVRTEADTEAEPAAAEVPESNAESPLDTEAEIAADYLEELLDIADLDGDIDTYIEGDRAHVSVITDSDVLVGPDGEVLDALQELTRLAVMTETGERSRLMLDVAGYREKRRSERSSGLRVVTLDEEDDRIDVPDRGRLECCRNRQGAGCPSAFDG